MADWTENLNGISLSIPFIRAGLLESSDGFNPQRQLHSCRRFLGLFG